MSIATSIRCGSRNGFNKKLTKIETTEEGKLNLWYALNRFSTCPEEIVSIAHVLSDEILLRMSLHYQTTGIAATSRFPK